MANLSSSSMRWNIFARELEDILATRGLKLGHLDDRGVVLHREKVRRLQQSLKSPNHLTTLNPDEMERLTSTMQLTELEQKQLRAALLATAVEMTLMDRIDPQTALMASNDVFAILFAAMRAEPDMVMASGIKAGIITGEGEADGDTPFLQALDLIDRATLLWHVSRNATTRKAQIARAGEAFNAFSQSLELLHQSQSPPTQSENWLCWYEEAVNGQQMVASLMSSDKGERL